MGFGILEFDILIFGFWAWDLEFGILCLEICCLEFGFGIQSWDLEFGDWDLEF